MRLVTFYLVLLALLLCAQHALANSISIRGGPSIQDGKPDGSAKYLGVRQESPAGVGYVATEFGGWADSQVGHKSSAIAKAQVGVNPGSRVGVYGKAFLGIAVITGTDELLGGHFQFVEDIGVGVRDHDTFVELTYSHISSAGLSSPNKGRDFIVFGMGVLF